MGIDGQVAKVGNLANIPKHFDLRTGFEGVMNLRNGFESLKRAFIIRPFDPTQPARRARRVECLHQCINRREIQI